MEIVRSGNAISFAAVCYMLFATGCRTVENRNQRLGACHDGDKLLCQTASNIPLQTLNAQTPWSVLHTIVRKRCQTVSGSLGA